MILPALLIADLHLTSNARDEYRWALFPWLRQTIYEERVRTLVILGDLTDAKDFHPSALVNRIASEFKQLMEEEKLTILMIPGNHEWMKEGHEFWRFLNHMSPRLQYMTRTTAAAPDKGPSAYFLPFTKNPARDWAGMNFEDYDFVFMHQTLKGAVASNGQEMEGEQLPENVLATARKIYSGDIHVPQVIGGVEYVGSPYHVHFGDSFKPRCVLLEPGGAAVNLYFKSPRRLTLKVPASPDGLQLGLEAGDQVKLRVELSEAEKHDWQAIRREWLDLMRHGSSVEVHGIELIVQKGRRRLNEGLTRGGITQRRPSDDVLRFVVSEELGPEALDVAMEVIES